MGISVSPQPDLSYEENVARYFDPVASLAITTALLELGGGRLNDIFITKLQYLVDKAYLLKRRDFAVPDQPIALYWGPVLQNTYRRMKTPEADKVWTNFVAFSPVDSPSHPQVCNTVDLERRFEFESELPKTLVSVIKEVFETHKHFLREGQLFVNKNWSEGDAISDKGLQKAGYLIHDWCTKNCPEYAEVWKPEQGKFFPITYKRIFELNTDGRLSSERIDHILEDILHELRFTGRYADEGALSA